MAATGLERRKIELLLDRVQRLPTLPGIAYHVLPLAMADRPNSRKIEQVLESDAALAARVLQLAIRLGHPAARLTSIDAVMAAVPVEQLAADLLTLDIVETESLRHGRLQRLWQHNLATAMAAQAIASRLGTVCPQEAQLAGLLHDIGLVALSLVMPSALRQVLERVEANGKDPLEIEREILGVDHVVVGRRLAQRWGFAESIQNAVWLHHQPGVALPGAEQGALLAGVVHLADLIVRREGYSFYPSERIQESAFEAAERLGLSGAHAEQIAHQVSAALRSNVEAVGLENEPTPGQLWHLAARANVRLGALYRDLSDRHTALQGQSRRADLLVQLHGRLAACRSTQQVLETVAETAAAAMDLRAVVPYLMSGALEYIEGVVRTAQDEPAEHFLVEVTKTETLETLLADGHVPFPGQAGPGRAERVEAWLFERMGAKLGDGPFYTVPMIVEDVKVGGIVFSRRDPAPEPSAQETGELCALASMAGVALKRAQAEADLTALSEELAALNRELRVAHEERLQQKNVASLSEMAAGAAHEINNPLAIMSGRAQQLIPDEKDAARRAMLESIVEQAGRASDILTELRQFARPPAPKPERVAPATLLAEVAGRLREELAESGVQLSVEDAGEAPPIHVDAAQVVAALTEIVRNGIDACAEGGSVALMARAVPAEAAVRITVVDNGAGMDAQDRARALDPFFSGRKAGRHRGLGLPKAFRAIQANGGHMAIESEPGHGTTVRVTFPAASVEGRSSPDSPRANALSHKGR